jgi:ribosomal protein S12 methylthiotransferase
MEKIHIVTLGCSKNTVDSEYMLGILKSEYALTSDISEADIVIINTCTFINDAKEESIEAIFDVVQLKNEGITKKIVLAGCLSQRYAEELLQEIPEIDLFIGTSNYDEILSMIKTRDKIKVEDPSRELKENLPRVQTESTHFAYVKISEGCDNFCTYCIIPKVRGKYRSRTIENVLREVKNLAMNGVREIILIAQDTSKYGLDLYGEKKLHELIEEIAKIEEVKWIRIHYIYPEDFYDELIKSFEKTDKLVNYFEIPLQHINNQVLKRMNRKTNREDIEALIATIRQRIPDAAIRTTLIVGFPGETRDQFLELEEFVKSAEFERLGVFTYSEEEDTPAYRLPDKIEEDEKKHRRDRLMLIQQELVLKNNQKRVGQVLDVIIDEAYDTDTYVGRSYMDSPDIDGVVYVNSDVQLNPGDLIPVKITDYMEYDLIGGYDEPAK